MNNHSLNKADLIEILKHLDYEYLNKTRLTYIRFGGC